jgi:hypothetical protein
MQRVALRRGAAQRDDDRRAAPLYVYLDGSGLCHREAKPGGFLPGDVKVLRPDRRLIPGRGDAEAAPGAPNTPGDGQLSDDHQEILRLAFYEDLPYEEIAALLSIPDNTVKTRVFYAKQQLKRCLDRLGEQL